jgi:hypothetical protein
MKVRVHNSGSLNALSMTSEQLKSLASKDKDSARNLLKYLNNQLLDDPPAKDPKDAAKDPKDAAKDPKDAKEPAAEESAAPDPEAEPVTGKSDPGLFNIIPTKFNITDDKRPLILSI